MGYSSDHNIAFIHIPKNAGKSIELALGIVENRDFGRRRINNLPSRALRMLARLVESKNTRYRLVGQGVIDVYLDHLTYLEMNFCRAHQPNPRWLTTVRNPYTRLNSLFLHHSGGIGADQADPLQLERFIDSFFFDSESSRTRGHQLVAHRRIQSQFIEDTNGQVVEGLEILDFESLQNHFSEFAHSLRRPVALPWIEQYAGTSRSNLKMFQSWTAETVAFVNGYFARDFETLGYCQLSLAQLQELNISPETAAELKRNWGNQSREQDSDAGLGDT